MQNRRANSGFTLIEIIIAVGIVAMSLLAIIAFLGAVGKSTSELIDNAVASQLADNIRAELEKEDIDDLYLWTGNPATPIEMVATKDGERVRMVEPVNVADNDSETGFPPGIDVYNRYFKIEIIQLEGALKAPTAAFQTESTMLPISVRVIWPHQVKTGPESSVGAKPEQQFQYMFNSVILRKE